MTVFCNDYQLGYQHIQCSYSIFLFSSDSALLLKTLFRSYVAKQFVLQNREKEITKIFLSFEEIGPCLLNEIS